MHFDQRVVDGVKHHMNEEHTDDALLIVKALGGTPDASRAWTESVDDHGIDFVAVVDGEEVPVRVPWSQQLTERPQIRIEVTRMYHEACEKLGVAPREAAEH